MGIEKTNTVNVSFKTQNSTTASDTVIKSAAQTTVNVTDNSAEQELLKRLGITKEQLEAIKAMCPEFCSLTPEKQLEVIGKVNTSKNEQEKDNSVTPETVEDQKENTKKGFDDKAFAAASIEDKTKIYAEEAAKNAFLYSDSENPKSLDDWNALPEAEKQELIKAALSDDVKKNGKNVFDEKASDRLLQWNMTKIQAANAQNISVKELDARGADYKEEAIHDYIFNLDNNRTEEQQKYYDDQKNKTKLLMAYSKKHGNAEIWGDSEYVLRQNEINQRCEEMGVTIQEIEKEHLEEKAKISKLTPDEQDKLKNLTKLDAIIKQIKEDKKNGPVNYGRMKDFENSEYGKLFSYAQGTDDKIAIAIKYLKEKKGGTKFTAEFISELTQKDPELAAELHNKFAISSSTKERKNIAACDTGYNQYLNSLNINSFDGESSVIVANTQKRIAQTDKKRAARLAKMALNNADGKHLLATSSVYSSFGIDSVEIAHADAALDQTRVTQKQQLKMMSNTHKYSGIEARKYAAIHNDKTYAENQIRLHNIAIKDKEVNDAMVQDGTYSRYAKENQIEAFEAHKHRYEQDDYSEKEAIAGLNKLSDFISKSHIDNQLAMHKEIMNSKYSEVQEHAASNISKYDANVQTAALNNVYKSGNTKAVEAAVQAIPFIKSQAVQENAAKQAAMELLLVKAELNEKFLNGTLTKAEIGKLSLMDRNRYIVRLFDTASMTDKLRYLKMIPAGKSKEAVYNVIGKFYPSIFKILINDVSTAEIAYNMQGLNSELRGIVKNTILANAEINPSFKILRDRLHLQTKTNDIASNDLYPPTSKNSKSSTVPKEFDTTEIYKKDKNGFFVV